MHSPVFANAEVKKEDSDPGFVEKLVTQIIKNVQVQYSIVWEKFGGQI